MLFLWFIQILTEKEKWLTIYNISISIFVSIFLSLSHCALDIFASGEHVNYRDEYGLEISANLK